MIKNSRLGAAVALAMRDLRFGPNHEVYTIIKDLKEAKARLEAFLPLAKNENIRSQTQLAINSKAEALRAKEAWAQRLKDRHDTLKRNTGIAAGLTGAAALTGGGVYAADKLQEPDMGDEFKLAEDWVAGFITKCAEYGVDGTAWLNTELDKMDKSAGYGSSLAKLLALVGTGAAGGTAFKAWRASGLNEFERSRQAGEAAPSLISDRTKDINSWGGKNRRFDSAETELENRLKAMRKKYPAESARDLKAESASELVARQGVLPDPVAPVKPVTAPASPEPVAPSAPAAPVSKGDAYMNKTMPRPIPAKPVAKIRKPGKIFGMDESKYLAMPEEQRHQYTANYLASKGRNYNPGFAYAPPANTRSNI